MPASPEKAKPALYDTVVLARDIQAKESIYRAGTRGQIVEVHERGVAFEVELTSPYRVITLHPEDLIVP